MGTTGYILGIDIGGMPIRVRTQEASFVRLLEERYQGFVSASHSRPDFELEVELIRPAAGAADEEVRVRRQAGRWAMERGDFRAEWDPATRRGRVRQSANPYAIDSVLRILHTLLLAGQGGFLVHAASAIRNGKAFLFAGRSGAGKTTLSRLAPGDVALLSDEISYVRREGEGYRAFGTPFAGELARVGENLSAPLAALYLLAQGRKNKMEAVSAAEAGRALLQNILFFAEDGELVRAVFQSACEFVARVPVYRLTFVPDARVWELVP